MSAWWQRLQLSDRTASVPRGVSRGEATMYTHQELTQLAGLAGVLVKEHSRRDWAAAHRTAQEMLMLLSPVVDDADERPVWSQRFAATNADRTAAIEANRCTMDREPCQAYAQLLARMDRES